MPHWPCGVNVRGLAQTLASGLMKASFRSLVIEGGRDWPSYLPKPRLGIEEIELARPAFHEQKNDVLRFGSEVGRPRLQGIDVWKRAAGVGCSPFAVHQVPERNRPEPACTLLKKTAPGLNPVKFLKFMVTLV